MPRKPTRSQNSKRPTRKNLDRRLDDVETEEGYGDLPTLTLAEVIAYETERVDDGVVRVVETGELRRRASLDEEQLERLAEHAQN